MASVLRHLLGMGLICLLTSPAWAAYAEVAGTVRVTDGPPVFDATVAIQGGDLVGRTDSDGRYHLRYLTPGAVVTIVVSTKGFATETTTLRLREGANTADFALHLTSLSESVTVEAEIPSLNTSGRVSGLTLSPAQIATLPSLGENDIFRALQLLPGIASRESSSGLYVRGGTPSQNLVSYDGFTVYHVDHLFGYFSAFNMDAVDQVTLAKGSFEARDGGRLGGVLDLSGKTGRRDTVGASGGVSLLSVHGLAEAPLGRKASLLVAGRRSFQGPLYDSILDLVGNDAPQGGAMGGRLGGRFAAFQTEPKSHFYDGNAKLLYEPSSHDTISLSAYTGRDLVDNSRTLELPSALLERLRAAGREVPENFDIRDERVWRNRGLSAQWRRTWGRGVASTMTLGQSAFDDENERVTGTSGTGAGNLEDNDLDDLTARFDVHAPLRWNHTFDLGGSVTDNHIVYSFASNRDTRAIGGTGLRPTVNALLNRDDQAKQTSAYIQERSTLFGRVTVSPGVRVTRYSGTEQTYVEPRVSASVGLGDRLLIKGAWGVQHQFANRVTREDVASGNREFWTLSDGETVPVSEARHAAAGFSYERKGFLLDVEAFHKQLDGLAELVPQLGPSTAAPTDLASSFHRGEGTARGIEALLQKRSGRHTGWVSYTLSQVQHTFPTLQAATFAAGHDQTHELKVVDNLKLGRWTLSGTWIFATGQPYTLPTGVETLELGNGFAFDRLVLGDRNEARLPSYHRMDVAANYDFVMGRAKARLGVSLFNLYDRDNVWYKEFQLVEGDILENDILLMGRTLNVFASVTF